MERLRALDEALLNNPAPFRPEVALVIDEQSMLRVAAGGVTVTRPGIYEVRAALSRMGTPYGQYLLDDVLDNRVRAKLYVFLNAWNLSASDRSKLLAVTRGAGCIWCYAPGYFEGERVALEAMRELTGFNLKKVSPASARATPTEVGKREGMARLLGVNKPVQPLFAAAEVPPQEVLASYSDGSAAVVIRKKPEGLSVFAGPPGLTTDLLRSVARKAGVHLFTGSECNVYANGKFLALHASQDGAVVIDIGESGPITDMLTGEKVSDSSQCTLALKRGETRVLRSGR
jgi:hypothetical protein